VFNFKRSILLYYVSWQKTLRKKLRITKKVEGQVNLAESCARCRVPSIFCRVSCNTYERCIIKVVSNLVDRTVILSDYNLLYYLFTSRVCFIL